VDEPRPHKKLTDEEAARLAKALVEEFIRIDVFEEKKDGRTYEMDDDLLLFDEDIAEQIAEDEADAKAQDAAEQERIDERRRWRG
jgi:hypothetical protein